MSLRHIPAIIEIVYYEPDRRQDSSPEYFVKELNKDEARSVLDHAEAESKVFRIAGMLERATIYTFDDNLNEDCYRWTSKPWKKR